MPHTSRLQKLSVGLGIVNVALFAAQLAGHVPSLGAAQAEVVPVLRGRALQIVDAAGTSRFEVSVEAPTNEGGRHQPDRVLLRIGSPGAGPGLKLVSSAEGTALLIMHNDRPLVQIMADQSTSAVRLMAADGRERSISP